MANMVLEMDTDNVMEYLWGQIEKTPDGKHIRYTLEDIDSLWWMGFVDTERYPLTAWRRVFEPYKREGGVYILNHASFLSLDQYRYKGEIRIPFDAMLINEGKYTDEGLQELFDLSIAPSTRKTPKELQQFIENLKKKHRQPDALIKIDRNAKVEIMELIDQFPSPLRNLEITFDRMLEAGVDQEMAEQLDADESARATSEAAKQVSQFSSTPTSRAEVQAKRLQDLQKAKEKPAAKPAPAKKTEKKKEGVELKKIKRSRRGMRG